MAYSGTKVDLVYDEMSLQEWLNTALMKRFTGNWPSTLSILLSVVFYVSAVIVAKNDAYFTYRWLVFWLHIMAVTCIIALYAGTRIRRSMKATILCVEELVPFVAIFLLAVLSSFVFLTTYPYVSVGDEVRDGGMDAMGIATGSLTNIFAYGRYDAHGLIIPTFSSFFYPLFGSSVLTFRFPAAIISCVDVAVVYLLLRVSVNRSAAFWGAFVLTTMPLHLFFGRTQIVVAFNSLWTSVILQAVIR